MYLFYAGVLSDEAKLRNIKQEMTLLEKTIEKDGKHLAKLLELIEHSSLLFDDADSYTKVRDEYLALQKTVEDECQKYELLLNRYREQLMKVSK